MNWMQIKVNDHASFDYRDNLYHHTSRSLPFVIVDGTSYIYAYILTTSSTIMHRYGEKLYAFE